MFRDGRVLCMLPVNTEHILLGTQAGKIWVFHTGCNELVHCTRQLQDSVLSLYLVPRSVLWLVSARVPYWQADRVVVLVISYLLSINFFRVTIVSPTAREYNCSFSASFDQDQWGEGGCGSSVGRVRQFLVRRSWVQSPRLPLTAWVGVSIMLLTG